MIDYSAGISVSSYPFTAPSDGILLASTAVNNSSVAFYVDGEFAEANNSSSSVAPICRIPVMKGSIISVKTDGNVKLFYEHSNIGQKTIFYPFKGIN